MRLAFVAFICTILASCANSAERAAALDAKQDATCRSYGATPGTDSYTQCRLSLNAQQQQQQAAILGMAIQNNQVMAAQQAQQQQNLRAVVQPLPPSTQTNCATSYIGNQAYTHCQ
jgi:hypothetical protein